MVLGGLWGRPPALDLEAEADLQTLLQVLAERHLVASACDLADGGLAVAIAQAAFQKGIGAVVSQDESLLPHPLFGLFAEPASTVLLSADPSQVDEIEGLASEYGFLAARIGTTGGKDVEIKVYGESFIKASVEELKAPWAGGLEAALHGEVLA